MSQLLFKQVYMKSASPPECELNVCNQSTSAFCFNFVLILYSRESMSQYSMNFDGVMNDKVCGVSSKVELVFCPTKYLAACIMLCRLWITHLLVAGKLSAFAYFDTLNVYD